MFRTTTWVNHDLNDLADDRGPAKKEGGTSFDGWYKYAGWIAIIGLWELAPRFGWADPQFLPSFSQVLSTIVQLLFDGTLATHAVVSLWRVIVALLGAALIGLPLGILLGGWLTGLAEDLRPLLRVFGQVNPFSLMPVFIFFFGIGEMAKAAVLGWVALWPILHHTITGVRMVDPVYIKTARSMNIARMDFFTQVLLPGAAPSIFVGLRIAVNLAFFILTAAEMIGASAGLGWAVHNAHCMYQFPRLYASAVMIIALGYGTAQLLRWVERSYFFWKEPTQDGESLSGTETAKAKARQLGWGEWILIASLLFSFIYVGDGVVDRVNEEDKNFGRAQNQPLMDHRQHGVSPGQSNMDHSQHRSGQNQNQSGSEQNQLPKEHDEPGNFVPVIKP
ncbi:ABC transporter permease [Heliophilum fasciatum]|uniref:ABC-type nitrate/sulfonate/bicarbonate transport system permease component n=1 Tax=Heliophilum fasciatum TaxID=35700 RepID=A0A4R2RPR1_9FIRM|nr:ABC transporter permease [Heliophilum fasciatum]MCW2277701.1 NitT/TauT family transport system permease protein [Heliophilum fasciatum]TCP65048.1 ABC-type nitrate/sulfonate/bicarbonate transport system permease component [Heliophilum fasciatum]